MKKEITTIEAERQASARMAAGRIVIENHKEEFEKTYKKELKNYHQNGRV